jgi:hypothetical protein
MEDALGESPPEGTWVDPVLLTEAVLVPLEDLLPPEAQDLLAAPDAAAFFSAFSNAYRGGGKRPRLRQWSRQVLDGKYQTPLTRDPQITWSPWTSKRNQARDFDNFRGWRKMENQQKLKAKQKKHVPDDDERECIICFHNVTFGPDGRLFVLCIRYMNKENGDIMKSRLNSGMPFAVHTTEGKVTGHCTMMSGFEIRGEFCDCPHEACLDRTDDRLCACLSPSCPCPKPKAQCRCSEGDCADPCRCRRKGCLCPNKRSPEGDESSAVLPKMRTGSGKRKERGGAFDEQAYLYEVQALDVILEDDRIRDTVLVLIDEGQNVIFPFDMPSTPAVFVFMLETGAGQLPLHFRAVGDSEWILFLDSADSFCGYIVQDVLDCLYHGATGMAGCEFFRRAEFKAPRQRNEPEPELTLSETVYGTDAATNSLCGWYSLFRGMSEDVWGRGVLRNFSTYDERTITEDGLLLEVAKECLVHAAAGGAASGVLETALCEQMRELRGAVEDIVGRGDLAVRIFRRVQALSADSEDSDLVSQMMYWLSAPVSMVETHLRQALNENSFPCSNLQRAAWALNLVRSARWAKAETLRVLANSMDLGMIFLLQGQEVGEQIEQQPYDRYILILAQPRHYECLKVNTSPIVSKSLLVTMLQTGSLSAYRQQWVAPTSGGDGVVGRLTSAKTDGPKGVKIKAPWLTREQAGMLLQRRHPHDTSGRLITPIRFTNQLRGEGRITHLGLFQLLPTGHWGPRPVGYTV